MNNTRAGAKARALFGAAARPLDAMLSPCGDGLAWTRLSPRDAPLVHAARLFAEGFSVREVGAKLAISRWRAHDLRGKAFAMIEARLPAVRNRTEAGHAKRAKNASVSLP